MSGFLDTVFQWLPRLRKPDQTLADAQCDINGRLLVNIPLPTTTWIDPANGTPLTYTRLALNSAGKLHQILFENTGATARWLMMFDQTTTPAVGANPRFSFPCAPAQAGSLDLPRPRAFTSGIYWAISSTPGTLTIDTGASFRVQLEVEV